MIDEKSWVPAVVKNHKKSSMSGYGILKDDFRSSNVLIGSSLRISYDMNREVPNKTSTKDFQNFLVKEIKSKNIKLSRRESYDIKKIFRIERVHSVHRGQFLKVNEKILLQLIDVDSGKVCYIASPERDASGEKLDTSKKYEVRLVQNVFSDDFIRYDLYPLESKKFSKKDIEDILGKLAESI